MNLSSLPRRNFLATTGAATSLICLPGHAQSHTDTARRHPVLGVYLPESARHPGLAAEYRAGLELGLTEEGIRAFDILPLVAPHRAGPLLAQTQLLLDQRSVDLLTGIIAPHGVRQVADLVRQRNVPLLASDAGAHRLSLRDDKAGIVRHSLELWQSAGLLGHQAPQGLGQRCVICMGFLESGYSLPAEFEANFRRMGGEVVGRHVSGLPDGSAEFDGLGKLVRQARADFVLALYSGQQADRFYQAYDKAGLSRIAPLAGLASIGSSGSGQFALQINSWSSASEACQPFLTHCRQYSLPVTALTVLGYEAGRHAGRALGEGRAKGLGQGLQPVPLSTAFQGARGERRYQSAIADSRGGHWYRQGRSAWAEISPTAGIPLSDTNNVGNRHVGGWLNSYLIT